jgi:site-specific recombinase XerD
VKSWRWHLQSSVAKLTVEAYTGDLMQFVGFLQEQGMPLQVDEITPEHVRMYISHLRDEIKPVSVKRKRGSLDRFFAWAQKEGETSTNPMEHVPSIKLPEPPEVQVFKPEEVAALLKATAGQSFQERRDRAIVMVLYDTGIRRAELVGMRMQDVDLDDALLSVTRKGGRLQAVPFGDRTREALDRYLRSRATHWARASEKFWLGGGGALTTEGVGTLLKRVGQRAGVPGVRPHRFRHSWVHELLASGAAEGDVERLAGWSRGSAMIRRYGSAMADERARAAARRHSAADRLGLK